MDVAEKDVTYSAGGAGTRLANADAPVDRNDFPEIHELLGESRFNKPFPLTDIQQAYWIGRQHGFSLGNISAHGYMEIDCRHLDLDKFTRVFNRVIQRHDMLRAVISKDGQQRILSDVPEYQPKTVNLVRFDSQKKDEALTNIRNELSHQVLDPAVWPLFDIRASQITTEITRLHISLDVLIFDAHSFDLISEELRLLYENETAQLKPLRLSFADYVYALNRFRGTELHQRSEKYWKEKLAELPPGPELPLAKSPETIERPTFKRRYKIFDRKTWDRFKTNTRHFGLTPSAALLAVYGYVLSRWAANKRFTLNLTLFNRLPFHEEVNDLVGDFTSVILLAMDYSASLPFHQQAMNVQQQLWNDLDHRFVSGVWVLRELQEANRGRSQIFMPVVFTSALKQDVNDESPAAMSWLGEGVYTITQTPQVWLDNQIGEDEGKLICDWDAVDELFPAHCVDAMFDAYTRIIEKLSQADISSWSSLMFDVLPPEQKELISQSNATEGELPSGLLHGPFLAQCERAPENIALIQDEKEITYRSLRQFANCLAHNLWKQGLEPNELVGVLLPKGTDQVIAVLGILEAGASYVPIEVSYPEERIRQLLELAGIESVISHARLINQLTPGAGVQFIDIDTCKQNEHKIISLPPMQDAGDTAYIIYTSGSTGVPKGVVIDHRGALNTVMDINQKLVVTEHDRVFALSALNFDLSVYDIFGLLSAGGALVFPPLEGQQDPASWAEQIRKHKVTIWNTVPALMDIYVSYLQRVAKEQDTTLRWVMMSGDWINLGLPDAIRQTCVQAKPLSLGGATEASIWSIWYPIDEVKQDWSSIPYGKPLRNQTFYVLDECMQPCPFSVPGELYIGGVGLARGYWRAAEKTSHAFVNNPHTGERLYRTGDLGRYMDDGNIEFLGRKDFQVKINGYRVELGEVEAAMLELQQLKSAVALVVGESGKGKQLVGYFVGNVDTNETDTLRFRLSQPGLRHFDSRQKSVAMPKLELAEDYYSQRRSHRAWSTETVPLKKIAAVLATLDQQLIDGRPKYKYASAGSLYPVQCYVYIKEGRVEGVDGGLFYYHPERRELINLHHGQCLSPDLLPGVNRPLAQECAFQIFLVANLDAIEPIYKQHGLNLCMLEAGLMTQLIEQEAASQGIGMCQTGGFNIAPVAEYFQMNFKYALIHALVGGMPAKETDAREEVIEEQQVSLEERLREHLREKLPGYMVPDVFVELESLPLSANGKVDRKALPVPKSRAVEKASPAAPATGLAKKISGVWSEVLNRDDVGVDENFFDLGGTSVDMIKIHAWLEPELPQKVSLVDMFFTYPTISTLVKYLDPDAKSDNAPGKAGGRRSLSAQKNRRKSAKNKNTRQN